MLISEMLDAVDESNVKTRHQIRVFLKMLITLKVAFRGNMTPLDDVGLISNELVHVWHYFVLYIMSSKLYILKINSLLY